MIENIENADIAVIGAGNRCRTLLEALLSEDMTQPCPVVRAVADKNSEAPGIQYAKSRGILTTTDYRDLFSLKNLEVIIELTGDDRVRDRIKTDKPPWILMIDYSQAQSVIDYFLIKSKKCETLERIRQSAFDSSITVSVFEEFYDFILNINTRNHRSFQIVEKALAEHRWATSQIIQGSSIPMFMIDKDHQVTYWNRALERLTGCRAQDMIGTDNQWKPFRSDKQPTMADHIVDGVKEEDLWRYYGTRWEKSNLIDGAYEVEEFFSQLGKEGTWLFFTAAPIKAPDGSTIGAIQTLWNTTREKQAEQQREKQNRELAEKVRELSSKERMMSQIIQGSTIPTFVIDKDHKVTHWNRALEKLTGIPASQIVGTRNQWKPFYEKERPSMADVILDQPDELELRKLYGSKWKKSALIEDAFEAEVFFPNLGGSGKWCWFTASPIKTPDGKIAGAIETIWDKTEDRKAEKERERHTRELATFCSVYATLSSSLNLEDRIKEAIQEISDIFLIDGICIFILNPEDGRFYLKYSSGYSDQLCYFNRVAGEESSISETARRGRVVYWENLNDADIGTETQMLTKEGFGSLVCIPILDKEKRTFGVIRAAAKTRNHFNADDIRALELIGNRIGVAIENSSLQEEVKRKAAFQSKLIKSSNDGIIATDDEWKIVIFNPAAEKIFGYSAKEAIQQLTADQIYPERIKRIFNEAMKSGLDKWKKAWQEMNILSKDGETIPVRFSGTTLHEKNRIMGTVAFFQDLREIKRLEKELLGAERLAAIGQTVAGMAHCIKNILHGLKGGSYVVNIGINKDKPEKLISGWQMVERNIARISDLVQDLLSYSKEREPEYRPCFPNKVVEEVCDLMEANAEENNVRLIQSLSDDIGEVIMDPRAIYRCLLNFVSNAIDACKFDESAGKSHTVTVKTTMEDERFVRFDVTDNGSGMTEEVKQKLFSSFFSTKGAQGTGLGLLVTRKLIEENQGTIDVTSQWGKGTTFSFRFPIQTAE